MTGNGYLQIGFYLAALLLFAWPLGIYMASIYQGDIPLFIRWLRPVERGLYRLAGVSDADQMHWTRYAVALLIFNLLGLVVVYALQRLQADLPFNPEGMAGTTADLAFNTAVSFATNTNWQSYGGESTMSYLTQMLGLTVQNFLSAATGMAVLIALARGFVNREANVVGNFWVDMVRSTLYILLPLSLCLAVALSSQGVVQTFSAHHTVTLMETLEYQQQKLASDGQALLDDNNQPVTEKVTTNEQTIAVGPVASQVAIKQLGTNGGGFFNANAAHPYENPTALSNFIQMVAIFAIGAGLTNVFGRMVGDQRQGWAIFAAMGILFLLGVGICYWAEAQGNPAFTTLGIDQTAGNLQTGGNMEGKEVRFGIANSTLFAVITTAASCGAVNAMHDSFTALGGMIPLVNMLLGEVIIGGVGAGLYGMLLFCILSVFIAGLMVGRTPEYVGKKIEAREVKMTVLAILCIPLVVLGFSALATVLPEALKSVQDGGPHGFSEILYLYTSSAANNGSAFGGFTGNTPFYNLTGGLAMFIGRFFVILPMLAIAGSLAAKKAAPSSAGTFPTHGPLFIALLVGVVLIVGGLTYFPALAVGPVVEHLMMQAGQVF